MAERLWFNHIVDAVFVKGLGGSLTAELKADLKRLGLDLDKMGPAYPIEVIISSARQVCRRVWPADSEGEALRKLGAASITGYEQTFIGRAAMQLLRLLGVRRALQRIQINMSSGNNFLRTTFTPLGEHEAELTLSDVHEMPTFYQGLFEAGARAIGAKHMKVELVNRGGGAYAYRLTWEA